MPSIQSMSSRRSRGRRLVIAALAVLGLSAVLFAPLPTRPETNLASALANRLQVQQESEPAPRPLKPIADAKTAASGPRQAERLIRTELYFGRDIDGRPAVSEADWRRFLDAEVTPRFTDGLTVLRARGQFHNAKGHLEKEDSFVLVILHPPNGEANARLEAIRDRYKAAFRQESVMRADSEVEVSY